MSTKTRSTSAASSNAGAPFKAQNLPFLAPAWVRNKAWPALPSITSSDEKFVGIYAVWPGDNNWAAVNMPMSAGNYSVNWGDGTTDTVGGGIQQDHAYDFADTDLVNTNLPVTFTDSTDKVGLTAQPYSNSDVVRFYNIASTTGITDATPYYVVNAGTNDFQVALTPGGSALALTTDGTGTMLPYKCAVVTITAITGGANFGAGTLNFCSKNATPTQGYTNGWLDMALSTVATGTPIFSGTQAVSHILERANIIKTGTATFDSSVFNGSATSLVNFTLTAGASITSMSSALSSCSALREVTIGTLGVVTNFSNTFSLCSSLQTAPALTVTSSCTTVASMFLSCGALVSVPNNYDISGATTTASMFSGCRNLVVAPLLKPTSATTVANMFLNCSSLQVVPNYSLPAATTLTSMFQGCTSLVTAPLLTFASSGSVSLTSLFNGCTSLKNVPVLGTTSNVTDMSLMFQGCTSLETVPLFVSSAVTNFTSMFNLCAALMSVPLFVTTAGTTFTSMFNGCAALQTVPKFDLGAATTLATMFSSCTNLVTVPLFNTANVTNFSSMFSNCSSLQYLPNFNTASGGSTTGFTSMITNDTSMREVPAWNMGGVTSNAAYTGVFTGTRLTRIKATGIKFTFTVANNNLNGTNLDEVYTNLATVTSQTITVSGNYGIATDTPSIATGKGWTVTGS